MWINTGFEENDLFDLIRDIGGDIVENVIKLNNIIYYSGRMCGYIQF